MGMIFESVNIIATNTDVLSVGRLNSIPYNGMLMLRFLADLGNAGNNFSLILQKPGGEVPVDGQLVQASSSGLDGVMDERELMAFEFKAGQGAHFVVSLTMTGTAVCMVQSILRY